MSDSKSPPSLLGPMSLRPATDAEKRHVLSAIDVGKEATCPRCNEAVRVVPLSTAVRRYECTHDACEFSFERAGA